LNKPVINNEPIIMTQYPLKHFYFILVFVTIAPYAYTQTDCSFQLDSAKNLFENGIIEEIPQVLNPCIEEGFTREQKISAYKLIILTYLFDDNQQGAESTMLQFLDDFPNYEIRPDDPVEFVYLFESYRTLSVFSVGFFMGPNLSFVRTIEPVTPSPVINNSDNKAGFATQFGLRVNRYLYQRLEANVELIYSGRNYSFEENIAGNSESAFSEEISIWEIPLYASYELNPGKIVPFVYAGPSIGFITSASGTPIETLLTDNAQPFNGAERDISHRRTLVNFSLMMGGGIKYKMPKGYFGVDLRFNVGLNGIVQDNVLQDHSEILEFNHIDDKFALNSIFLSIGYHYTLYQPRKIR